MNLKEISEVVSNLVTSLGIILAGVWSYYTFVLNRTFSGKLQISVSQDKALVFEKKIVARIRINAKNIGRGRIQKKRCTISVYQLDAGTMDLVSTPIIDFSSSRVIPEVHQLFVSHEAFEPLEEVVEEIIVSVNESPAIIGIKINFFSTRRRYWQSNHLLTIEANKAA